MSGFIDVLISVFIIIGFILIMWAGASRKNIKEIISEIIEWLDNLNSDVENNNPLEVKK
jgi:hypothetical protein